MTRYFALLLMLIHICSCAPVSDDSQPLKVFVFAGQSNMLGKRIIIDELPANLQSRQEGNLVFADGSWITLEPGVYQEEGAGPELSFAYEMARETGEPIGIIKHSLGGTDLDVEWSPENPTSLYAELLAKIEDAKSKRNIEIVGMTWMQGESDSEDASMANNYEDNLVNLVASAREDFGGPDMYFVAGRINPPLVERYAYGDQVRSAQSDNDIARYDYVDCDDLSKLPDDLHYDTPGTVKLGEIMAEKMMLGLGRAE